MLAWEWYENHSKMCYTLYIYNFVLVDYGNSADPTDSLSRYQIAMEIQCHKQCSPEDSSQSDHYTEAKRLWKDVMTRHGREAKYWMEYAKMER